MMLYSGVSVNVPTVTNPLQPVKGEGAIVSFKFPALDPLAHKLVSMIACAVTLTLPKVQHAINAIFALRMLK